VKWKKKGLKMTFKFPKTADELTHEMLAMPVDALRTVSKYPLNVFDLKGDLYEWLARAMADEIIENNKKNQPTRWVLPVGPKSQYPILAKITNEEHISWKNVFAFHMDEYLDWQGRMIDAEHPFSFRGFCKRNLYDLIDEELKPPESQIVFPNVENIDEFSEKILSAGGIDTLFGGFGYRGLIAFVESPSTRWLKISADELANSKTRIVKLREDTIIALSQRMAGGNSQVIPPMAITIGMKDMLAAKKVHLILDGGAWKQYILRIFLLTTEKDADLPVTLFHDHPNVIVSADVDSAKPIDPGLHI
jgi:glucosamine-6-phosphate deaminase